MIHAEDYWECLEREVQNSEEERIPDENTSMVASFVLFIQFERTEVPRGDEPVTSLIAGTTTHKHTGVPVLLVHCR